MLWHGVWKELTDFVAGGPTVLAIGGPSRLALAALGRLPVAASLYDAMDDFPEFYQRDLTERDAAHGAANCGPGQPGDRLLDMPRREIRRAGRSRGNLRNACGIREFPARPADRPPRKVLGYVGCIADWFDWPLVMRLAESVPDVDVELVGPCFTPPPTAAAAQHPHAGRLRSSCSLHAHLNRFTAGLIPFRINRVTASVDPIKYYDYRAFGLPVLSTNFGEMGYRQPERRRFLSGSWRRLEGDRRSRPFAIQFPGRRPRVFAAPIAGRNALPRPACSAP